MTRSAQVLLLLCFSAIAVTAQHKVSISVKEGRTGIRISIDDEAKLPRLVAEKLLKASNYRLKEERKLPPDFLDRLATVNQISDRDRRLEKAAEIAKELGPPLPNLINTAVNPTNAERIDLELISPLEKGKNYQLRIDGLDSSDNAMATVLPVNIPAKPSGTVINGLDVFSRNEIRVSSTTNAVQAKDPRDPKVDVKIKTYTLKRNTMGVDDKLTPYAAKVDTVKSTAPNEVTIKLGHRLKDNQSYKVIINDLTDGQETIKDVTGTVKFPGLPGPPDDPKWDLNLSSVAAVNQKPEFNLTAKINPRSPESLDHKGWLWQPNVAVDVGLGATKSNNSITFAAPFVRSIIQPPYQAHGDEPPALLDVKKADIARKRSPTPDQGKIPSYKRWSVIPWLHLSDAVLSIGPKVETDRKFKRINTLGSVRFDFHFPRLMGSIKQRRKLLKKDLKEEADFVELNHGFSLVPYASVDFGRHVNNETIKQKVDGAELSLLVPRHTIFRTYGGMAGSFEWRTFDSIPTTLTLDESIVYMVTREKIGYATDKGVFLRQVRGLHPHFKTTLSFAFDPAKHYSFEIVFENGRLAPNFEYLNKLSTGIRVLY